MKTSSRQIPGGVVLSVVCLAVTAYGRQDVWRLDHSEPITYFVAEGSAESGFKERDRPLAEWALNQYLWLPGEAPPT